MALSTVEVYKSEIGESNTRYGSPMKRLQRQIEPLVTLVEYPTIEASRIVVKCHFVTVYRTVGDTLWSSDFASVTRYASKRVVSK